MNTMMEDTIQIVIIKEKTTVKAIGLIPEDMMMKMIIINISTFFL